MSFLSSSQLNSLTGIFDRHFQQFSTGKNNYVEIYREPIKIINNNNSLNMFGYEESSLNETDITYSIQSGRFPAMTIYNNSISSKPFTELKFNLDENQCLIKVKEPAKQYIEGGKVEYLIVDGNKWNLISNSPRTQSFLGSKYYFYKLQITQ